MDALVGPTFTLHAPPYHAALSSSSSDASSSIGTPDDTDDENDAVSFKNQQQQQQEQVHHNLQGLASLDSLEDSLPIKRGLSNHFMGKSKSFTDLSQVNTVKELQKQENPFNKRRRVQIASKWSRKSSFYASSNPKSMPLLPLHEDEDYYQEEENRKKVSPSSSSSSSSEDNKQEKNQTLTLPHSCVSHMRHRLLGSFKCRSLSDLKEHDEEEDDEDEDEDDDD
ncbi:uncharacterized protein LOC109819114 [Cajanus cajan]|uniref:Uncharacterized protein n=1 Tax=Cajanus cajan TaxID=3821 RepID=A0A151RFM6_CAJCA|nr:uncharacterized protein LOC109819114 [Cajanus cajan]KYP41317.1 hypothetical protein KK1_037309 [Cajanus cajan]